MNNKSGAWLRPVNSRNHDAVSEADMQYENGSSADLLDIISVPMDHEAPHGHQKENHQINPNYYWKKQGRATWDQVVAATDKVKGSLWNKGDHSYHGMNDKVSQRTAETLQSSLLLIKPEKFTLVVGEESQYGGGKRRRIRATFKLNNVEYNFVVTDPWVETKYFAGKDGSYPIAECRTCISLAEVIGESATKLVASVITPDRTKEK